PIFYGGDRISRPVAQREFALTESSTKELYCFWRLADIDFPMSAFGGKADMTFAARMSVFDPKRTLSGWCHKLLWFPELATLHEPAFGPKQTSLVAPHMSAFEGKADMPFHGSRLGCYWEQSGH